MISLTEDKGMLGYELLNSYPNIFHFVTTRQGGCSQGSYATFNCSPFSGDNVVAVSNNQQRLHEESKCADVSLVIPHQVHRDEIALIDESYVAMNEDDKKAYLDGVDALITHIPHQCICISTADCVPLLFYDKKNNIVAAAHAGWRGTVQGIAHSTLKKMHQLYGTMGHDVIACIGPSISLHSFEVGEEVYHAFLAAQYNMSTISQYNESTGKHHIDLWRANQQQLLSFGIPEHQIQISGICTYQNHKTFFSARRLGIDSGRILSGIMLKK